MRFGGVGLALGQADAAGRGWKITVEDYDGSDGFMPSMKKIALMVRAAIIDPDLVAWVTDVLAENGLDGRNRPDPLKLAEALLDAIRKNTIYRNDPLGVEFVQHPSVTLCLKNRFCIRGGDCDDLLALLCAVFLIAGLGAQLVIIYYGYDAEGKPIQPHVLCGVDVGRGQDMDWRYADAATWAPLGTRPPHIKEETWIDPLAESSITGMQSFDPKLVGVGKPHGGGGGHGHGGGHHGGGGHGRQWNDGHWWDWNGADWTIVETDNVACTAWSGPLPRTAATAPLHTHAEAALRASDGAPVTEWNSGHYYLYAIEGGVARVRQCEPVGVGKTTLGPRGAAVGVGFRIPPFCNIDVLLAYKRRLIPLWTQMKGDVDACGGLSLDEKFSFKYDWLAFDSWAAGAFPTCDADAEIEEGKDFEQRYAKWRARIVAAKCTPSAPEPPALAPCDPKNPAYDKDKCTPAEGTTESLTQTLNTLAKAGAVIGASVLGIYGLTIVAPAIRGALAARAESSAAKKAATAKKAAAENPISPRVKTGLLVVGGVALAGGVAAWALGKAEASPTPSVSWTKLTPFYDEADPTVARYRIPPRTTFRASVVGTSDTVKTLVPGIRVYAASDTLPKDWPPDDVAQGARRMRVEGKTAAELVFGSPSPASLDVWIATV